MGFGKSFLLSLVAFVGLNFIFTILYYSLGAGFGALITEIQTAPLMIIYYLFGSIASIPSNVLNWVLADPLFNGDMTHLIIGLGFLIAPLIAAILAGKLAESKFQGFSGWLLTVIVSTVAVIIGIIPGFSSTFVGTLTSLYPTWTSFELMLIYLVISCVINIIFYGFFALLVSKTEYY
ncbi:MAG: hypothetical protein ACW96X_12590 [Promethearchaeota archaeon]|jgi:hypothetical protein